MGNECACLPKNIDKTCLDSDTRSSVVIIGPKERSSTSALKNSERSVNQLVVPPGEGELNTSYSSNRSGNRRPSNTLTYKVLTDEQAARFCSMKEKLASCVLDQTREMDVSRVAPQWYECNETHEVYRGEMINQKKNGKGEMYWPDGSAFKGNWVNDVRTGYGILIWADGKVYVGEWKNNKMNGKGMMQFPDGTKYTGNYVENMKSGNGEFVWPNKKKYIGQFSNNTMHGKGIEVMPNGERKAGTWDNGKRVE